MKRVLIITYYWPPAGGPGVQRVLKFVKYLPEFGWQPIVLTVKNGDYPATDNSLKNEIPHNVKVFRCPIWEPYKLYRKLSGKATDETIPVAILAQNENLDFKSKLLHWIRANLFLPDARVGWYFQAVKIAKKIIQDQSIDRILVSSPPHSLQLIGLRLKKDLKIPFISDFRDPWTDIHYYQNIKRMVLSKSLDNYLERKVLANCDKLITVSPALKRLFKSKTSHLNCDVIFNGYDTKDFSDIEKEVDYKNFTISYVGNFKDNQNVPTLWQSLKELLAENDNFANDFKLHLTGKVNSDIKKALKNSSLMQHTVLEKYVPHAEAIKRMQSASVLLFIIPKAPLNSGILTGKIFDYLGSCTPFLSLGPNGDAAKLLNDVKAGPMFSYDQKKEIKNYIVKLYRLWKDNELYKKSPNREEVQKYNRKSQTEKLSKVLNRL